MILSLTMTRTEFSYHLHGRFHGSLQSMNDHEDIVNSTVPSTNEDLVSNNCSLQPINIDVQLDKLESDDQRQKYTMITITSVWKKIIVKTDSDDNNSEADEINDSSISFISLNTIQVIFTVPSTIISNESILNRTVFITDIKSNQLLASLNHICFNGSSFIINYSTNQSLPYNMCLYVLISSITLREIFICCTINNNSDDNENQIVGPSISFIMSQSVISLLLMLIINLVQTSRKKNLVNCVGKHFFHNKLITHKNSITILNDSINSEMINDIHLKNFISSSVEEQVLAANDLTSTRDNRRFTHHTLIDIKELAK
ncbi:unnamed protein product [Rotaria sp. Silwood2]|nr:unnamed protein product [Rotaria sp. Silwood2]CAF2952542.1 unnamed protein product [Rotaria sp. Silwood2]CAF3857990.1 unnamed protein product [Rotaria sp. Silwood2]CAF4096028.1 unnamed protein product [Rotaria sp. Silwood2]